MTCIWNYHTNWICWNCEIVISDVGLHACICFFSSFIWFPEGFYRQELIFKASSWRPSGTTDRKGFLSANRQENFTFPDNGLLSANSWWWAIRNRIPDGISSFPDGFWPSGTCCFLVVPPRHNLLLSLTQNKCISSVPNLLSKKWFLTSFRLAKVVLNFSTY